MDEYTIGYIAVGSIVGLAVTALLYMIGGRKNKGIRRFGASFIISATLWGSSLLMGTFSFFYLLAYPLKIGEYCIGYGGHSLPRYLQRIVITLTSCVCGLIFCVIIGGISWFLLILQLLVGIGTVLFAIKNPLPAAAEEPLVCCLNNIVLIFYPFILE